MTKMGIFSKYKATQVIESMRAKDPQIELEVTSEVVLNIFKGNLDEKRVVEFISTLPQKFVTSNNTTILDEYINNSYYNTDKGLTILRAIIAHDPSYALKPYRFANNKMEFFTDIQLPNDVLQVILNSLNTQKKDEQKKEPEKYDCDNCEICAGISVRDSEYYLKY